MIRQCSRCGWLIDDGDGTHRRAVGAVDCERQRDEATARGGNPVEIGEVFDDRDAGGEEDRVGRVLGTARLSPWLGDGVADAVVGRIVVPDRLDAPRDEPFAAARSRERALSPELW